MSAPEAFGEQPLEVDAGTYVAWHKETSFRMAMWFPMAMLDTTSMIGKIAGLVKHPGWLRLCWARPGALEGGQAHSTISPSFVNNGRLVGTPD